MDNHFGNAKCYSPQNDCLTSQHLQEYCLHDMLTSEIKAKA